MSRFHHNFRPDADNGPVRSQTQVASIADLNTVRAYLEKALEKYTTASPKSPSTKSQVKAGGPSITTRIRRIQEETLTEVLSNLDHVITLRQKGYRPPEYRPQLINGRLDAPRDAQYDAMLLDWETPLDCDGYTPFTYLKVAQPVLYAVEVAPILPDDLPTGTVAWDILFAFSRITPVGDTFVIPGDSTDLAQHLLKSYTGTTIRYRERADRVIATHLIDLIDTGLENTDCVDSAVAYAFALLVIMVRYNEGFPAEIHQSFRMLVDGYFNSQFPTAADVLSYLGNA